jgi:aminoglycoside phosphotransferase
VNSPAQAAVTLAPDPVLPRRDDLLDDELVGTRLDELLGRARDGRTGDCARVCAKYRMGESLRATYRVGRGVDERLVSARMFPAASAAGQFLHARDAAVGQGADPGSVLFDPVTSTVFWVFPQDRKLLGLGRLTSPPPELRSGFAVPWTQSELKAYKPEKAATVRCADAHGRTVGFAKLQRGDAGRRSVALLRAARRGIAEHGILRLPKAIGYLREQHEQCEQHLALFSPAPGCPLDQLRVTTYPDAMATLGAALSVLHAQPTDGFVPFTRLGPAQLVAAGDLVCAARPDLAPVTDGLVDVLLQTAPTPGPNVLLHGDLHFKNVLVHESGVSLVDFDEACAGPASAELGGVLARLWCPGPRDTIDPDTAQAAAEALLAGYDGRPSRADLLWYAAAALLVERAVRAIRRVDVAAIDDLERVLVLALRWAGQRGADRR